MDINQKMKNQIKNEKTFEMIENTETQVDKLFDDLINA